MSRTTIRQILLEKGKTVVVGIPGFANSDNMFGVTGNYMKFADSIGNVRIIMPWEEFVDVDLLLMPGGLDLSPSSYGAIPDYKTGNHDVFKEFFFKQRLKTYLDKKVPTFGICLGFQMLNVALGGTLTQHLMSHAQSAGRWATAHEVEMLSYVHDKGKLKGQNYKIKVNSHHHQAVLTENLAGGLVPQAIIEDEDGIIVEAYKHKELPIAGVQWHPEELYDFLSEQLILELLSSK